MKNGVFLGVGGSSSDEYGTKLEVAPPMLAVPTHTEPVPVGTEVVLLDVSANFCSSFCFCCCSFNSCTCFCCNMCSWCSADAIAVDNDARAAPAVVGTLSPKLIVPVGCPTTLMPLPAA